VRRSRLGDMIAILGACTPGGSAINL
jgi:hypothetical protein